MKIQFPLIYPITDTSVSRLSIPEQVRRLAAAGSPIIQIREKKASSRDFYTAAAEAMSAVEGDRVRIIINDRVDIAMLINADGVHLGQEDLPPADARRLLGIGKIIGYSTHTISQAAEAVKLPIDYLAFGPIFRTSTKEKPDPTVGLDRLAEVKRIAGALPLVAIGGINADNARSVLEAGADSVAVISGILADAARIESNFRSIQDRLADLRRPDV